MLLRNTSLSYSLLRKPVNDLFSIPVSIYFSSSTISDSCAATDSRAISTGSLHVINPCDGHATVSASARVSNARNRRRARAKKKKGKKKTRVKTAENVVDVKPNRARFSSRSIIQTFHFSWRIDNERDSEGKVSLIISLLMEFLFLKIELNKGNMKQCVRNKR